MIDSLLLGYMFTKTSAACFSYDSFVTIGFNKKCMIIRRPVMLVHAILKEVLLNKSSPLVTLHEVDSNNTNP